MGNIHRGKIKKQLAESVQKNIIRPNLASDLDHSYQSYLDLNKSHAVMLTKKGIISKDVAKEILRATQEMAAMGEQPAFPMDPQLEGMYFNLEKYLIDHTSLEIGGQLHTARSRNDMIATLTRMDNRKVYFLVCEKLNQLRETMIAVAEKNKDAVLAGYTHQQPSEPITFAQYISGILAAFERDYARLSQVFTALNICPMGGGCMASTTWDIDTKLVSDLLGFEKPIDNSIDAVGSRDYVLAILGVLTVMGNTMSRMCTDLYNWSAPEFGYVEVDDSVAICSSIMPQKKNPYTLEYVRGRVGNILGYFVGGYSAIKNTPYSNVCDAIGEGPRYLMVGLKDMVGCIELLIDTLGLISVNKDRMRENALGNFCTAAELANSLVRSDRISFRAAHAVVAQVVDYMLVHKLKANEINVSIVNDSFEKLFGRKTNMSEEQVKAALDPVAIAMAKIIIGGSAEKEVQRQLESRKQQLEADKKEVSERLAKVNAGKELLENEVNALIQS